MKKALSFKKIFLTLIVFLVLFSNTQKVFAEDVFRFIVKEKSTGNLLRGLSHKTLADCNKELSVKYSDKAKYEVTQACKATVLDKTTYYFTWQETTVGYKTEVTVIGKEDCEIERAFYKIASACSTKSQDAENDVFNKTAGKFAFNWQLKNAIENKVLEGGGATVIECNLDRGNKIGASKLSTEQLKLWTVTKSCSEVGAGYYYFTWQDPGSLMKSEEASASKKECEDKIASKKYASPTECYTVSRQTEIQAYNKARDPDAMPVNAQFLQKNFEEDYTLLAPIGGLKAIGKEDGSNPECKVSNLGGSVGIGCYLNMLLLFAIGLCGALAVIMIVIRGVQYMGDESVFGKTEAKHHIMGAIMGLLLALGAYALLNTINPNLVGGSLTFNQVEITISADDTSTGSSTTLCLSNPPPNPDSAKGSSKITLNDAEKKYIEEINKITSIPKGNKLLMIAQTHIEGFKPGTKSYKTNNPGNIGNTDKAPANWTCSSPGIKCFDTLADGIKAQSEMYARIGTNTSRSYVIGGKNTCALGSEPYDGSLYQYLWIYSTGARTSNSYANQIIGYFAQEGKTITARTKMSEIYKMK